MAASPQMVAAGSTIAPAAAPAAAFGCRHKLSQALDQFSPMAARANHHLAVAGAGAGLRLIIKPTLSQVSSLPEADPGRCTAALERSIQKWRLKRLAAWSSITAVDPGQTQF